LFKLLQKKIIAQQQNKYTQVIINCYLRNSHILVFSCTPLIIGHPTLAIITPNAAKNRLSNTQI